MGDTFIIFKFSGNLPCFNERLKKYLKGVKNISEVSFTLLLEEMLSHTGLLLGFKFFKPLLVHYQ